MRLKRLIALAAAIALVLSIAPAAFAAQTQSGAQTVTVFHTNDIHGALEPAAGVIDASMIKGMVNTVADAVLVDAGDGIQGSAFATLDSGDSVLRVMNAMGYAASAVGNHEFDYGQARFMTLAAKADYPYLSANAYKDGSLLLAGETYANGKKTNNGAWTVVDCGGIKLGFVGLTTPSTIEKTSPKNVEGLSFGDSAAELVKYAASAASEARAAGAEAVIGLFHIGEAEEYAYSTNEIAEELRKLSPSGGNVIDAIVDGHTHEVYDNELYGIPVAQTGTGSKNLGRIDLSFEGGKLQSIECSMLSYDDVAAASEPDEAVAALLAEIAESNSATLSPVVGSTSLTLEGGTVDGVKVARLRETLLGDAFADALRAEGLRAIRGNRRLAGTPVVALTNGGGLRASIGPGEITAGDLLDASPFGNYMVMKSITARELYDVLEYGVAKSEYGEDGELATAFGGFPQIAGMKFMYDPSRPAGEKVLWIKLDGETRSLRRDGRKLLLATTDYIAGGGDGYDMLSDCATVTGGRVTFDYVCEYFETHSPVNPAGGRIIAVPCAETESLPLAG